MLSRAKASKETTYCVLTEFRETDMFLRPLERLSEVENPTLRAAHTRGGGYTQGNWPTEREAPKFAQLMQLNEQKKSLVHCKGCFSLLLNCTVRVWNSPFIIAFFES